MPDVSVLVTIEGKEILSGSYKSVSVEHKRNIIPQYGTQQNNWGQVISFEVENNSKQTIITLSDKMK